MTAGGDEGLIPRYLRPFVAFTSSGTPRLVNIVCHKLLLSVYGEGKKAATSKHLVSAILDTEDCRRRVLPQKRLFFLSLALVAALGTWQMTLGGL